MSPLVQLLIASVPSIIQDIKDAHAAANPTDPPLTSEQVLSGFEELFTNTIAKDEAIKVALAAEV